MNLYTAQNITNSLNKASMDETNIPYFCHCLPQLFPDGEECQLSAGGNKYPTTIQYPKCGGSTLHVKIISTCGLYPPPPLVCNCYLPLAQ